jgi:cytochrome c biogenesis protein CcdA
MNEMLIALITALWLGILTSISPCPMTTNIAAVSFIARRVDKPYYVLFTGIFYAVGRSVAYAALGILLVKGLLSMSAVSYWLQKYMNRLLGPVLIITAMVLLDLIRINTKGTNIGQWAQKQAENFGLTGALFLGAVFALSFCPISAALFFGSLIPLSVEHSSGTLLPFVYGIGTALPVFAFAVLIAAGAASLAKAFQKVSRFELWARRITGIIFLLIGIYFTIAYTLGMMGS